jgi:O-acetyl-ADP-ribose deacetylase (regulator of RNase III)
MPKLKQIKGCAIEFFEQLNEPAYLMHQVNCQSTMASGIALTIKKKYPQAYIDYINHQQKLGQACFTQLGASGKYVVSLFGQEYYGRGKRQTNYAAFTLAFMRCFRYTDRPNPAVVLPKFIGCDRAGGDWRFIEAFLEDFAVMMGVDIYVCEL